jgi:hypothetical protein
MKVIWPLTIAVLALAGCSDSRPVELADSGINDAQGIDASQPQGDSFIVPDTASPDGLLKLDQQVTDAFAADLGPCGCKPGEVWRSHSCLPTTLIGCGPGCDPTNPTSCPANWTCDQWGALACCHCAAAVPACIPKASGPTGPLTGPLRITPTSGIAGQPVKIVVEGAPFYIGALFYMLRMAGEEKMDVGMKECSVAATFTPSSPGLYAVEVSQYGGQPPWVLAGFYLASGGSIPPPSIQPGYPCKSPAAPGDPACAQAPPYTCQCLSGRCACK